MRGMVVGEGGRSSGVLLYSVMHHKIKEQSKTEITNQKSTIEHLAVAPPTGSHEMFDEALQHHLEGRREDHPDATRLAEPGALTHCAATWWVE